MLLPAISRQRRFTSLPEQNRPCGIKNLSWCFTPPATFGYNFALSWMRHCPLHGSVAQPVEQRTFNPLVASSNLARPTRLKKSHGSPWLFSCTGVSAGKVTINVNSCLIRAGARIGGLHSRDQLPGGQAIRPWWRSSAGAGFRGPPQKIRSRI